MSDRDVARIIAAGHAIQSGVMQEHADGSDDGSPKHLRVGVINSFAAVTALVNLLIERGVFTQDEYVAATADAMENEVVSYEERLTRAHGVNIHLA